VNWTWTGSKGVRIEDPTNPKVAVDLETSSPVYGDLRAFDYEMEKARRVYMTLESARDAFEGGRASYQNATAEVKNLIEEANKAAMELIDAMSRIDRWFESPVSPLFQGDADGFLKFCKEWIARQGPSKEVLGNSSRGRSGNSPPPPPEIAEIANGSSLEKVVSPFGSASGKTKGSRKKTAGGASTS
jgi:hypothetical protein